MAREMKDSGVEWFGEIPIKWRVEKIDAQFSLRTQKVNDVDFPPLSVTKKGILPQLENVAKTNAHDSRKLVKIGDFAINSRSDRRGSCGISEYEGSVSLINTVLKPNSNNISKYLDWLFHTIEFADEFYRWGHGIVDDLWTTNWSDMKKISIPIPPLEEQKDISNFLDKKCSEIDSLTADIEKQISLLEDYKKSIITGAVTKGLNPNVEMKNSGIEWIGKIPKHWIISKIKHIAKINPKCDIRKLNLDSVVTYSPMECIRNNVFENRPINYEELPPSLTRFQEGDLVMAKVSPCFENGNISIMKDLYSGVGFGSSELFVFRSNPITTRYLCYFLQNTNCKNYEILSFSGIAGLQRINSDHLRNTNITIPNINEQKQIADYLDKKCSEIDSLISEKKKQLEKLSSYKQSMIYEYVTGKKEVPTQEIA